MNDFQKIMPAGLLFGLLMAAVFGALYYALKRRGLRVRQAIIDEYGSRIRLISGCGVISGPNRVPGVIALLDDRLIHRAMIIGRKGEIPLDQIRSAVFEDTTSTTRRRAAKYRKAVVMAVEDYQGREWVFVLAESDAGPWEQALKKRP